MMRAALHNVGLVLVVVLPIAILVLFGISALVPPSWVGPGTRPWSSWGDLASGVAYWYVVSAPLAAALAAIHQVPLWLLQRGSPPARARMVHALTALLGIVVLAIWWAERSTAVNWPALIGAGTSSLVVYSLAARPLASAIGSPDASVGSTPG